MTRLVRTGEEHSICGCGHSNRGLSTIGRSLLTPRLSPRMPGRNISFVNHWHNVVSPLTFLILLFGLLRLRHVVETQFVAHRPLASLFPIISLSRQFVSQHLVSTTDFYPFVACRTFSTSDFFSLDVVGPARNHLEEWVVRYPQTTPRNEAKEDTKGKPDHRVSSAALLVRPNALTSHGIRVVNAYVWLTSRQSSQRGLALWLATVLRGFRVCFRRAATAACLSARCANYVGKP